MITFRQFLRKYGITLLPVSVETTMPGDVLSKKNRGYFPYTHLNKILQEADSKWTVKDTGASVTEESVKRSLSLKNKYSLRSMGVNINGGLSRAKTATYAISGVKAKQLKNLDTMQVEHRLEEIKSKKKRDWRRINGKSLVELTFYATEFTIDFEVEGNIDLSAEVGEKITHDVETKINWTTNTSLKIATNDKIPFGFKSMKIR